MAHLALDFGNTSIKAGSFFGTQLSGTRTFPDINALIKESEYILEHSHVIICSVTNDHLKFIERFGTSLRALVFTSQTLIPIQNHYQSSATLGSDRLAASIGAYELYPNSNVLCIDCGTCIKYNFVNAQNEFLGGAISPGVNMRFRALEHFTNKLPLVEKDEDYVKLIGQNTNESILSGVMLGAIKEIQGMIEEYQLSYPDIKIVITGGDGNFIAKHLKKNSIFTHPNLVLIGLNQILTYNIEKK
jgi:type III pantothenate kinase